MTVILSAPAILAAQDLKISGMVESKEDGALTGAVVVLSSLPDSTMTGFAITDGDGHFIIDQLDQGDYTLKVSFVGFEEFISPIRLGNDSHTIKIKLVPYVKELSRIVVESTAPNSIISGDTTAYYASGFRVNPDATAEELLAKLPVAVSTPDGLKVEGEDVQKVLVDGTEFFSNDPNIALKNLPAGIIEKIEIFDQLSEESQFTGFDDGETLKTVNIVTKVEARHGTFGKLYGAYGTDSRFSAGGNINFFNGESRWTILGLSNNINQQNFSTEDLSGILSGSTRGGGGKSGRNRGQSSMGGSRFSAGGSINNFLTGNQSGISEVNSSGVNYNDQWGDKWKVNGSYFFNSSENINEEILSQQFFRQGEFLQQYEENSTTKTDNLNHRFNANLIYDLNNNNIITLRPAFSLQKTYIQRQLSAVNITNENELANESITTEISDVFSYNLSTQIFWRHRFQKGKSLTTHFNTTVNETLSDNVINAETTSEMNDPDFTNQVRSNENAIVTLNGGAVFSNQIGANSQLMVNYNFALNEDNIDNQANSLSETNLPDTTLSAKLNYGVFTQTFGVGYQMRKKEGLTAMARLNYQFAKSANEIAFPEYQVANNLGYALLPGAVIKYSFNQDNNITVHYRTAVNQPTASQLQPAVDNSNTLQLTTGNPNLTRNYSHSLVARYSNTNISDRPTSFFGMLYVNHINDYIANSSYTVLSDTTLENGLFLSRGTQINSPVNLDGYLNIRSLGNYSVPMNFLGSKLNIHAAINFSKIPGLVNGIQNNARMTDITQGFALASNISPQIDFTLSYAFNYNIIQNDIQQDQDQNYKVHDLGLKFNWISDKGFVLRNETILKRYDGFTQDLDPNMALWNISVGKKLFKNDPAELAIKVYDLLNQNQQITRNLTETYVEDLQTNVLQQYYMVSLTYKI